MKLDSRELLEKGSGGRDGQRLSRGEDVLQRGWQSGTKVRYEFDLQ